MVTCRGADTLSTSLLLAGLLVVHLRPGLLLLELTLALLLLLKCDQTSEVHAVLALIGWVFAILLILLLLGTLVVLVGLLDRITLFL